MRTKTRLSLFLLAALVLIIGSATFTGLIVTHASGATPLQYVALGDSLALGYQPDGDIAHGYATDLFGMLQAKNNYGSLVNLSCTDDSTTTFISGDPQSLNPYRDCLSPQVQSSNQLAVALAYLKQNASETGLVTLQVGIDNFLNNQALSSSDCTVNASVFKAQLAIADHDLTKTILPDIKYALASGHSRAKVILIDYYNPVQVVCPNTIPYLQQVNRHLNVDARGFASFASIYNLFTPSNLCQTTWICNDLNIHPTTEGYSLIANQVYKTYLRGIHYDNY